MTLPDERYRALKRIPEVLYDYARRPGPIKKGELRRLVGWLLRHYPAEYELRLMAKKCPTLLKVTDE